MACGDTDASGGGTPFIENTNSATMTVSTVGGTVTTGAAGATASSTSASIGSGSSGLGGAAGGAECGPMAAPGSVLDGDLVLLTPDDVETAQGYSEVTGSLAVSPSLQGVELPNLLALGGDIHFESLSLITLALPNLRTLGGELWLYLNLELLEADFRNLEEVGGRVYIHRNIALRAIQLFSLTSIGGMPVSGPVSMEFSAQPALPTCFEDRLIELIPNLNLIGSDVQCACAFTCDLLVADC
jgi:hypothetical protein